MAKQKFADLPPAQQRAIVVAGAVQLTLLAAALFDISRRPQYQIKGPKPLWVGISFINTIGLIGGFGGPYLFGLAESKTGNPSAGFTVVIWSSVIGVLLALGLHVALRREDAAAAALRREDAAAALALVALKA